MTDVALTCAFRGRERQPNPQGVVPADIGADWAVHRFVVQLFERCPARREQEFHDRLWGC